MIADDARPVPHVRPIAGSRRDGPASVWSGRGASSSACPTARPCRSCRSGRPSATGGPARPTPSGPDAPARPPPGPPRPGSSPLTAHWRLARPSATGRRGGVDDLPQLTQQMRVAQSVTPSTTAGITLRSDEYQRQRIYVVKGAGLCTAFANVARPTTPGCCRNSRPPALNWPDSCAMSAASPNFLTPAAGNDAGFGLLRHRILLH